MPNATYTSDVVAWLKTHYKDLGPTECANRLGPPFSYRGLVGWAYRNRVRWVRAGKPRKHDQAAVMKRLWATGALRKQTKAEAMARGRTLAKRLAAGEVQHPRGMLGKSQTDHCRKRSSEVALSRVADGTHPFVQPRTGEQRQQQSNRMVERLRKTPITMYSHARRGYREDLGAVFFRSRWEANYARYLNLLIERKAIAKWEFEVDTFWFENIKRGVRSYTPDFKVYGMDGRIWYEEVKGWMDKKSATKLKRMKKYHPTVQVIVVGESQYKEIEKALSGAIPHWERK